MDNSLTLLNNLINKLETNIGKVTGEVEVQKTSKEATITKKSTPSKPTEKPTESTPAPTKEATPATPDQPAPAQNKKKQKKKQKKPKKPKKPKKREQSLFEQVDLRVGKIIECSSHPDSEKLYIEKIEVGEEEPRQILSGLQKVIPIENMTGNVIVWANLKPKPLAGTPSFGMVMCAQTKEKGNVTMIRPCPEAKPGDKVYLEGMEEYLKSQMKEVPKDEEGNDLPVDFSLEQFLELKTKNMNNSKKLKKVSAALTTDADGNNCFGGFKLRTKDGLLISSGVPNGVIL
jgi:aminoacyl tRNA synthase complex-interacting multifunctional protein 1